MKSFKEYFEDVEIFTEAKLKKSVTSILDGLVKENESKRLYFDDLPNETQAKLIKAGKDHETLRQDIDRYFGDQYSKNTYGKK